MNRAPRTALSLSVTVLLALGAAACGSGSDSAAGSSAAPSGDRSTSGVAELVEQTTSNGENPDACTLIDISTVAELSGLPLSEPRPDGGAPWESACTFWYQTTGGTNVNVVLSTGWDDYPIDPPYSTEAGFAEISGATTPVDGVGMPAWSTFDGSSVTPQASVLATDGSRYVLVSFTGDSVTAADTPTIARVATAYVDAL